MAIEKGGSEGMIHAGINPIRASYFPCDRVSTGKPHNPPTSLGGLVYIEYICSFPVENQQAGLYI